ncbi:MAG: PilZ domain-containing protein [Gammaproteobacteria bacterium]|nr:PilZ domain-containing protein [Gammaproteobacteria bacterium]
MSSSSDNDADKRLHERTPLRVKIKIVHDSFGERVVRTRDISIGGVFVLTDQLDLPPGSMLAGQIQDDFPDRPVVQMEVVRVEATGLGLKFLD